MSRTLHLTEQLISCHSVTPDDGGCQALVRSRLEPLGFEFHTLVAGPANSPVTNLWALRRGTAGVAGRLLAFAGHTDVVPPGPREGWTTDPFVPTHRDGRLYGRGAADMKTSIAAMIVALEEFVSAAPGHQGSMAFLLTSDEEGPAIDGTVRLCEWLAAEGVRLDCCIVGEPTSVDRLGDTMKNGRRGSLSGKLKVAGVQGHIAYPQLAKNPIHLAASAIAELVAMRWDEGNRSFPPTSWQMSNIHAGTGAGNVIPGELAIDFNFRFSTESTPRSLKDRVHGVLDRHDLAYDLSWTLGGEPFLTEVGVLSEALSAAICTHTGIIPRLSTSGGTSDGRFIAKVCPQVIEFGPLNASIHKLDEWVEVASMEPLKNIYRDTLLTLLT